MGILFHLSYVFSIFDIYFVSPLVHGMKHFNPMASTAAAPPAERLFLIVGDGLRADKCFDKLVHPITEEEEYLAPFIRSKALNDGTFGVSHTRMPTESRPGHVALIAGFYEDVSAVTKGWKENPVDFDSVFNQTRHTYSYGSPDILPMFAHGASDKKRIETKMYGHDFEDFTKSSIDLDKFVFDHVSRLFASAEIDKNVDRQLRENKQVFFLHLLGIDTAGHSYRPYSAEYYDNIKYIDSEIAKLEKTVEAFYGDGKTAFVFTADHGMSDFGSHGDGHPDNTRTPIVAWGAGVPKPVSDPNYLSHEEYSKVWGLPVKRNDINQADVASLMSYLLGTNYPANSVGELPLSFVEASEADKAFALKQNAYTIIEQYLVKEKQTRSSQYHYVAFEEFEHQTVLDRKDEIESYLANKQYKEAVEASEELMKLGLEGLRYLQTYNWLFLRTLVSSGFLGWIAYALTSFLHQFVVQKPDSSYSSSGERNKRAKKPKPNAVTKRRRIVKYKNFVRFFFAKVIATVCAVLYAQGSPLHYYMYAVFPGFFWEQTFEHWAIVRKGMTALVKQSSSNNQNQTAIVIVVSGLVMLEAIVYGYFHREIFSLCFGVALLWPWIQDAKVANANLRMSLFWATMCLIMACFTVLPIVKQESITQILAAGAIMTVASAFYIRKLFRELTIPSSYQLVSGIQLGLIILSTFVTYSSVKSLQARRGLPLGNQALGWTVFAASLVTPLSLSFIKSEGTSDYRYRLLTIIMAFCPTFIILAISFEGLFYIAFSALLLIWVELETEFYKASAHSKEHKLSMSEIRVALFFFFFSQIAFFGTGNIASISSFSLDSVRRLIPIFDPFAMGALLLFKLLIPFAVLSVSLGVLNLKLGVPQSALFAIVLAVSDILSLNFFFLVVDEGSWLEIGTGISHFCISSLLCLFMIVLEYLSGVLVSGVKIGEVKVEDKAITFEKKVK